jgi:Sec-independent protein secretion pathway component TatC
MVLYEISIVGAKVFGKKKPAEDEKNEENNRGKRVKETTDEHE